MKNIENFYPLSPIQEGILFHTLYAPDSGVYLNQTLCTLHGNLNVSAFEQAWQQVVERHSILRTAFVWEGIKEPIQVVYRHVKMPCKQYDWQELTVQEQQERLNTFLEKDRKQGFELNKAPLMRLTLIRLAVNTYQFVWSHHHLLLDGWSWPLLLKEVTTFYEAYRLEQNLHLPLPRPYRDYIVWLQQQKLASAEVFWRQVLRGFTAPTPLGFSRLNDKFAHQIESYGYEEIKLAEILTTSLKSLAVKYQVTLNTIIQGAWALLLSRYSGEDDVVFGTTVSGRPAGLTGAESMVGLFINTLPVRVKIHPEDLVSSWLKTLQTQQIEARQYEYTPLVKIQGWSEVPKSMPLFESLVVFENYPIEASLLEWSSELEVRNVDSVEQTNYPLTLAVVPGSELLLGISYSDRRFDVDTISRMLASLQTLLTSMSNGSDLRVSDLPIMSETERQLLLFEWNHTQFNYTQDQCIHQLFASIAEQTPDAVAVVWEDEQLTYQQLNQQANQLARYLKKLGVKPEVLVGICMERSVKMLVGLLGILKAGGAYVPLDPSYPQDRLTWMLSDAQVSVLITQQHLPIRQEFEQLCVVNLDTDWAVISQEIPENFVSEVTPENLAYVIYTSGSTGKPKGVMVEHKSLVNFTEIAIREYGLSHSDRVLQFSSISFDVAVEEIYPCLISGGTLVLRNQYSLVDIPYFLKQCQAWQVTILDLPTAYWHQLTFELTTTHLQLPESLRLVIIGGESALPERVKMWQNYVGDYPQLFNTYGPTEATVVTTIYKFPKVNLSANSIFSVPIGKPIYNTQVYILDQNLQPVPIGIKGELYIGGVSLARGYWHRPDLTEEKFIPNPFNNSKFHRLYKTGDLGRYLSDGNIEFLGRLDNQVKVRGFRIEPGEIEVLLTQHSQVKEAVVVAQQDTTDNQYLIAYVVPTQKLVSNSSELRHFIKQKLPEYMIPQMFVILEALPLTPNGKVDVKALPKVEQNPSDRHTTYVAPRTSIEAQLARIWSQLLGLEQVGIHDNFFTLGGHSLLLTQLIFQVRTTFQVDLPLHSLWEMPTVASLAENIVMLQNANHHTIDGKTVADLQVAAVLDPAICLEATPSEYTTDPANVFLTGATGFLGAFLLDELLQKTTANIYCLVRAANAAEAKNKLYKNLAMYSLINEDLSSRIIPVVGDLSQPLLGLEETQFLLLANQIDVIYHNGALVNFIYPYAQLQAVNVLGTQEVLRLACVSKVKPVHYISTLSVFPAQHSSQVQVFCEQDSLEHDGILENGYAQSKWVAEKLVKIAKSRGIPVSIYRLGRVTGHSKTGMWNTNDFMCQMIKGCIKLGSVPRIDSLVDMTPIDYISQAVIYLSRQKESIGEAFHLFNPRPIQLEELIEWVNTYHYPLEIVTYEEWRKHLIDTAKHSLDQTLYSLVPLFPQERYANFIEGLPPKMTQFDCNKTLEKLANTSIICPSNNSELLENYFRYFVSSGFLTKPRS